MKLDFEKALTFVTKDPAWVNKTLAGTGILMSIFAIFIVPMVMAIFAPKYAVGTVIVFGLCFLLSCLLCCALTGFVCETANKRINYSNSILPDWKDFGRHIVTGIKYFLGYMIYFLPVLLVTLLFLFVAANFSVSVLVEPPVHNELSSILIFFTGVFAFFVYAAFIAFCPLMMANFFKDLKIVSFVDFKEAFCLLKGNVSNYVVLLLLFIALSVIAQILFYVLLITVVGIIFMPFIYFYLYLVMADIASQFVHSAKED